jgi:hypothetical protein
VAFIGDEIANCAPAFTLEEWSSAMSQQRRRLKHLKSLEQRLAEDSKRLREQANLLPPGKVRDAILKKAMQAETGAQVSEWLSSPDLRSPK